MRRKPVRYIRKVKAEKCEVCGDGPDDNNPFQNAHRIGFEVGIVQLALTPEFLDGDENIVTAHRMQCNKEAERDLEGSMRLLRSLGIEELPEFLPPETLSLWRE